MGLVATALVVSAASGVASGVNSVVQSQKAARQTKRAGRAQAAALRAEAEAERQRGRRLAGQARASLGAAGVGQQGSPLFLNAQNFIENVRARERILAGARNVELNSSAEADALRLQGIQGALSGIQQTVSAVSNPQFPV